MEILELMTPKSLKEVRDAGTDIECNCYQFTGRVTVNRNLNPRGETMSEKIDSGVLL